MIAVSFIIICCTSHDSVTLFSVTCEDPIQNIYKINCTKEFYAGSICEVSCKNQSKHYVKAESVTISCGIDGFWDKPLPECVGKLNLRELVVQLLM